MQTQVNDVIREDLETITSGARGALQRVVNSHVVLTGASGFIGKWLTLSFLHAREELGGDGELILNCRNSAPLQELLREAKFSRGYEILECDVRHFPEDIIQDETLLIHAATPARATLNSENPLEMFDIIIEGQKRLLHLASMKKSVRFLFLSSGAVYGPQPMDLVGIPETWVGAPDVNNSSNAYHEGKRAAELIGNIYSSTSTLEFVSARLFAFLAPFLPLNEHFAAGNFIQDAVQRNPIQIKSGGGSIRSYQYSTDLCIWLWNLLVLADQGSVFNVGSDEAISIKGLANLVAQESKSDVSVKVLGKDNSTNLSRYVPDISRANEHHDLVNTVPAAVAIQRMYRWLTQP